MIFDQYSRYKACAHLLGQAGFVPGNSVLDIGSGPECLFERFLSEAVMTFVDPLIASEPNNGRISGTLFTNDLDGRTFDCVSAVDVLEHVPPEFRQAFLERMCSLAKSVVILGFPASDGTDALMTDRVIEDQYRGFYHSDYSWLEEHHRFGLPSISETIYFLEARGWHCQAIGHGHAPWLRELLGFVICAWNVPALKEIVMEISERFNNELFSADFRAPHYRQFVVATRIPISPLLVPVGAADANAIFRDLMTEAHRKYFAASLRIISNPGEAFRQYDAAIAERDAAIAERDAAIAERDAAIAERDAAIAERDAAAAKYEYVLNTNSWKLTKPLRFLSRFIKWGLTSKDRQMLLKQARQRYHQLPLPYSVKRFVSNAYHNGFRSLRSVSGCVHLPDAFKMPDSRPVSQQDDRPDYVCWGVIDWHFRHQRPQQLAQAIANSGRRVFYVSPSFVDAPSPGFEVERLDDIGRLFQVRFRANGAPIIYSAVPCAETIGQIRAGIGELLQWTESEQLISLVQHPYWYDVAAVLPNSRLVYDCMDHHEGFGNNAECLLQLERVLLAEADLTVVTSAWLDEVLAPHARRRTVIRNAAEYVHFAKQPSNIYRDAKGRSIIGYYGAIAEWFDVDLVAAVARQHPECCVLLIGHDSVNAASRLGKLPNVEFVGEVSYNQLPYYLYGFDVCLLPFKIMPLTLATNPVKAYEYLSAGKPLVAVDLPEMVQFDGLLYTAADRKQFLDAVSKALTQTEPPALIQRRKEFAAGQTWEHRSQEMIAHAESTVGDTKVSVIVVTYNNLELTKACLSSLDERTQYENLEIIVVDNASSDGSPDFLQQWSDGAADRKLILNHDNRGFAAANNQGLAAATGEYLVLLNNDTYVTPGWVCTLIGHLRRDKSIGLIGPVTNNIGNEAKINITYTDMSDMLVKSSSFTRRHIGQLYSLRTAAFFCVMLPRATYVQVGPLDEAFGKGFFEDDDYCERIKQVGKRIVCAEDVFIHHQLSASFDKLKSEERHALFERNKALYEAKWGAWIPHIYREQTSLEAPPPPPAVFKSQQTISGICMICGKPARFFYQDPKLHRESLNCEHCRSTSRYRSIARGILLAIHEMTGVQAESLASLSASKGTKHLRVYDTQPPFYYDLCAYPIPDLLKATGWINVELSQFKPQKPLGTQLAKGITNQNLECLTFADKSLDIVITSDVMEHVRLDETAHREIHRVLKPGGVYIFTVPHDRSLEDTLVRVQVSDPADPRKDVHLLEPEYHGDTNSDEGGGVLSYRVYGKDLDGFLVSLGFEVEYFRKELVANGIMNTELFYCRKSTVVSS